MALNQNNSTAEKALLAKNAGWSIARYLVNWLALITLPPFIIKNLSAQAYGAWMLVLQIAAYHGMLDVHLQTAVSRFVAQSIACEDKDDINQTISSIFTFLICLSFFFLIPGVLVSWNFGYIFSGIPSKYSREISTSAVIVIFSLLITWPFTTMVGTYLGLKRNKDVTIAIASSKAISTAAMIACLQFGGSFIELSLCFSLGLIIPIFFYIRNWNRLLHTRPVNLRLSNYRKMASFASYSSSSVILSFSSILLLGLALPILSWKNFSEVAPYSLAIIFGNLLLIPQSAIIWAALPRMAEHGVNANNKQMGLSVLKFSRLSTIPLVVLTAGLLPMTPYLLTIWVGKELSSAVALPAILLIISQFITLTMHPYRVAASGTGEQLRTTPAIMLEGVCNIVMSLILVDRYGAIGIALAACIGSLIGVLGHTFIGLRLTKSISVPNTDLLNKSFLLPCIAIFPSLIASYSLMRWDFSIYTSAFFAFLSVILGFLILSRTVLTADDLDDMRSMVMAFFKRRPV